MRHCILSAQELLRGRSLRSGSVLWGQRAAIEQASNDPFTVWLFVRVRGLIWSGGGIGKMIGSVCLA